MNWIFFFLLTCVRLTYSKLVAPPIIGNSEWWQTSIIYEIYPLSFKDSNGDGFGDLRGIFIYLFFKRVKRIFNSLIFFFFFFSSSGITQKLDYLVDLGIKAILLTPFFESPLKSGGYDVTNHTNIQTVYGTTDDFQELTTTARKKRMYILIK